MRQLSVVIVNWNTRELLSECIQSIHRTISVSFEILVVDNASIDGSPAAIRSGFPNVQLIECGDNLGFAVANNYGLRQASGVYVLLLNPDTELQPGAIDSMIEHLDENPSVGAVGPMLVGRYGELQFSASPAPDLLGELSRMFRIQSLRHEATYDMAGWGKRTARDVEVLQGACLMIRREALDEVGLLDEDYFMYTEEVDLCYRLRKAGWSIHWLPTARVIHYGGESTKQVPTESFLNLYRSKILYFRKHHGAAAAVAYKLVLFVASLARLIASPLALFEKREQRKRHLALASRYGRLLMEMPGL